MNHTDKLQRNQGGILPPGDGATCREILNIDPLEQRVAYEQNAVVIPGAPVVTVGMSDYLTRIEAILKGEKQK